MHLARKLFLVAAAAIAMIAFAAPAANAVEVSTEADPMVHCPEVDASNDHVVTGGCVVEAETGDATPVVLRFHATMGGETVLSLCNYTFDAALHESGDGFIYNQIITDTAANACLLTQCDEAEPDHDDIPWPATLMEFGGATALQFTFCIRPIGAEGSSFTTCTIYVPWAEGPEHAYTFTTLPFGAHEPGPWQSRCSMNAQVSISGQWTIHGTSLEITH